ncbi:MAG: hypothetical protein A2X13_08880 [Bacteroidetes bacterium GWC2_33_15]|nr:MAG: hypothetical protein A2X10_14775 [Bacteroidetes bacterium GWA2_33_15]OFX51365.1 MAG: hypothetical protein A2X13_08880 [Bacteroidetes bacterium GWC2_33_15]OFX63149.1 MAG: hypothetical protein A2X15_14110 [Bacteroidetes bacterium GWB2_32_14]OFX70741.1 MAG: hypothetical protein A2X14_11255 [Bacteroidetes bacterium GWD2_33_33]HAN18460.1 hypothetical protein [Bacteroidales bacterium]
MDSDLKIWLVKSICIFLLIVFSFFSYSQTDYPNKQTLEDIIENIASSTDIEIDYTSFYEDLNYFLNNPLNLNSATKEDLEKLQVLNDFQINSLTDYIKTNGEMLSIYELQLVFGFNQENIELILPFITVGPTPVEQKTAFRNLVKYGNNQFFIRTQQVLEEQEGYSPISDSALAENPNSRYLGSPLKIYSKYKYNYKNKISFGFTAEKDAGEEFFEGTNTNGFDFYSAHLVLNDLSVFKTITLGDFQAKFGQGLVMWSDMSSGKSSYVLNIRKKTQGLTKYSSANENEFLRGIGTTVSLKFFELSVFYSQKNIDANIVDSIDNEIESVSSFQNTGTHAIPSEVEDKNAIKEQISGANISYNHAKFRIGLTGINYQYGAYLAKETTPQNQFDFQGKQNSNLSIDYQFALSNFSFFGEEAISENGGKAFLNGALISLVPQVSMSVLHRYYEKNYQSNYSGAFAESSEAQNESGLYLGLEIYPVKHVKISTYFDSYNFPWIRSGADAPSNGTECFIQTDYTPVRNVSMNLRFKYEDKQVNENVTSGIDELVSENNLKIRFQLNYSINDQLSLKNRIETSKYKSGDNKPEYGYLAYQDIFYTFNKIPLTCNLRYAVFDTDTYNARIYAYESDMLYAFSIPAYYSKGTRFYFNLKYSITKYIDLWIRYSQTYYSDLDVISSGLSEIQGNTKSEIKAQIRIKL